MATNSIKLNGATGEGGGQILRTALALSMVTGTPFTIENIRANRPKPGLLRQHLAALRAACEVSGGEATDARVGTGSLAFTPGAVRAGEYRFTIGSAGSTTLVLQTVLPALMLAGKQSVLLIDGGTHNTHAPTATFFEKTFLPTLARMGPRVALTLERHGFYPAGGGRVRAEITPTETLTPVELLSRGELTHRRSTSTVAAVPGDVAKRENKVIKRMLGWEDETCAILQLGDDEGPGNVLSVELGDGAHCEVFTGFGRPGISSESVAKGVIKQMRGYLAHDAPVGEHLADQLLIPMALAGRGAFRTGSISSHTRTNADVIEQFLPVRIKIEQDTDQTHRVELRT